MLTPPSVRADTLKKAHQSTGAEKVFGSIDKSKGLLFVTYDLGQAIQNMQQKMQEEIASLDGNQILNTPVADLVAHFAEEHKIDPITLLKDQWYADTKEVRVDVRRDPLRWIQDQSKPCLVPGERIEVHIPFEGDSELFYSRANTYSMNPPGATVESNELVLRYESPSDAPKEMRPLVDQALKE